MEKANNMRLYAVHVQPLHYTQTVRDRELKFDRMFTPYHVSQVMCQVSHVMCHMSGVIVLFFYQAVELLGGGSVINRAYPV